MAKISKSELTAAFHKVLNARDSDIDAVMNAARLFWKIPKTDEDFVAASEGNKKHKVKYIMDGEPFAGEGSLVEFMEKCTRKGWIEPAIDNSEEEEEEEVAPRKRRARDEEEEEPRQRATKTRRANTDDGVDMDLQVKIYVPGDPVKIATAMGLSRAAAKIEAGDNVIATRNWFTIHATDKGLTFDDMTVATLSRGSYFIRRRLGDYPKLIEKSHVVTAGKKDLPEKVIRRAHLMETKNGVFVSAEGAEAGHI